MSQLSIKSFFHNETFTYSYVVYDESSMDAIIIDPALDFDYASGKVSTEFAESVLEFTREKNLKLYAILETHIHADHISAASYIKKVSPEIKVGISKEVGRVAEHFLPIFGEAPIELKDYFDLLLKDEQKLEFGSIKVKVLSTPGHTPACTTYEIGENLFTGDLLFVPDAGCGRCDFPMGSAEDMYESIQGKIYPRPDHYNIYVGHDYGIGGRDFQNKTTVKESKASNARIPASVSKKDFISSREGRDKELDAPRLLLPSLQLNLKCGRLPESGFLKIPIS